MHDYLLDPVLIKFSSYTYGDYRTLLHSAMRDCVYILLKRKLIIENYCIPFKVINTLLYEMTIK